MKVISLNDCKPFTAGDKSLLREILSPLKDKELSIRYSLAYAIVSPGQTTLLHMIKNSEVYHIIKGSGIMRINEKTKKVKAGDTIYIPPNSKQQITNDSEEELIFICIVDPAWKKEDETILEES